MMLGRMACARGIQAFAFAEVTPAAGALEPTGHRTATGAPAVAGAAGWKFFFIES